jgi:outer membrane protein OmpA-like peptidoglycan-associated protein
MNRRLATMVLCGAVATVGCATKSFVQEQVTAAETKFARQVSATEVSLGQRAETQEAKLRETADQTGENRQAIDTAAQQLSGLDSRVGEVDAVATGARAQADRAAARAEQATTRAEQASAAAHDAETRLAQRLAGRNKYRVVETKAVHFDSDRIQIRKQDVATLEAVAGALAADSNAVLELQGFADTLGSDRYNRALARERVEVVMRYLMEQHGIELRQLHGIAVGKIALAAGEKPTSGSMAEARRVDLRILTPWSSWEDRAALDGTAAPPLSTAAPSALPAQLREAEAPPPSRLDAPARGRLPALLRTLTPRDLGGD